MARSVVKWITKSPTTVLGRLAQRRSDRIQNDVNVSGIKDETANDSERRRGVVIAATGLNGLRRAKKKTKDRFN